MAQNLMNSRLSMVFYGGVDVEGKDILKTKNFSNVDIAATGTQLKATAEALATLQTLDLDAVTRNNVYDVFNV